jgi:hypothetical protein
VAGSVVECLEGVVDNLDRLAEKLGEIDGDTADEGDGEKKIIRKLNRCSMELSKAKAELLTALMEGKVLHKGYS